MQVSHYKLMYQLQEKTERSAPPFCVSGGKNLKHILVYSCAGGWISYTAGSMLFVVKSYKAKKCNNGADHSLCLVSFVFLCNGKTIYRVQIFVRIVSKKKGLEKQIQTSNTNVYLWENYLKLPSFSSHTAWQNCPKKRKVTDIIYSFFFFTMTTLQSRSFWTGWKLQRDSNMCHNMVSSTGENKNKKTHWLTFVIQTGSRSSHKDLFLAKSSLYQTFHFSATTPVFSTFEDISPSRTGWEVTTTIALLLHCVVETGIRYRSFLKC